MMGDKARSSIIARLYIVGFGCLFALGLVLKLRLELLVVFDPVVDGLNLDHLSDQFIFGLLDEL